MELQMPDSVSHITNYLPDDVVADILARLPTKAVCRCKTLSKKWLISISSRSFAREHMEQMRLQNRVRFRLQYEVRFDPLIMRLNLNNIRGHERSYIPIVPRDELIANCNGFILICDMHDDILIWNPSTNYYLCLPWEDISPPKGCNEASVYFGMGFDSTDDDYKVLRISLFNNEQIRSQVQIYSRNGHQWRDLGQHPFPRPPTKQGVYVHGGLHWYLSKTYEPDILCVFDLSMEQFHTMSLPLMDKTLKDVGYEVSSLNNDELILFSWEYGFAKPVVIWLLKDYYDSNSWISYSMNIIPGYRNGNRIWKIQPLYRIEPGEDKIMIRIDPIGMYGYCNLSTKSYHFVPALVHGVIRTSNNFNFVESIEDPWVN